eukprot:1162144-Pelagomonas_calceolata.AAC.1
MHTHTHTCTHIHTYTLLNSTQDNCLLVFSSTHLAHNHDHSECGVLGALSIGVQDLGAHVTDECGLDLHLLIVGRCKAQVVHVNTELARASRCFIGDEAGDAGCRSSGDVAGRGVQHHAVQGGVGIEALACDGQLRSGGTLKLQCGGAEAGDAGCGALIIGKSAAARAVR